MKASAKGVCLLLRLWPVTMSYHGFDGLLIEQPQLDVEPDLMALIRGNRMRHERRSIVLKPQDLTWRVDRDSVKLDFSLDAGCFATALIRELIQEIVERNYQ